MAFSANYIYELHHLMRSNNVLLTFTGSMDLQILNALVKSVKHKLGESDEATLIQKRVYNTMVECLESVLWNSEHYSADKDDLIYTLFTLSKDENYYYLYSGNNILNTRVEKIKTLIDKINTLSPVDKKELYRKYLSENDKNEYNVDLAMLDMAIKSSNKLEYDFKSIDEQTSFYLFQIKIKIN